ncbi:MAG TPA: cbb3-type cytochrome oxidase assembly protein CcoS, partial [Anaeromyxobacteraceae bacterium]|nr:cbb3-type cytochrome oxidase assembly protein CcoS [Anaeromyxobacteraceae bacterium]
WLFFLWSVRSGQYDDPEGPKYRMLDDEEEPGAASEGRRAEPGDSAGGGRGEAERGPR